MLNPGPCFYLVISQITAAIVIAAWVECAATSNITKHLPTVSGHIPHVAVQDEIGHPKTPFQFLEVVGFGDMGGVEELFGPLPPSGPSLVEEA